MGDVLMTTPAIRAIRESVPGAEITLLTSPAGAEVARLVHEIDAVLTCEAPWMKVRNVDREADLALIETLRRQRFDAAVIFTTATQSALPAAMMCYLADIPLRLAHCRENPYHLLSDWIPYTGTDLLERHEVQRQLDLVSSVGFLTSDHRLSLAVPPRERVAVRRVLAGRGLDVGEPWCIVHAGASAPSRRYDPGKFAAVIDALRLSHGIQVVLSGSTEEQELVRSVEAACGADVLNLAGTLTLAQLAALIEAAPLLISNNSGPVHIAAAVGTPVVDIYALTNPQHTPWAVPHRLLTHDVPCRNCLKSVCPEGHHNCLALIPPEAVVEAVLDLWGSGEIPGVETLCVPSALAG
jgi:lipopolysaccharide heptosyltransferase II